MPRLARNHHAAAQAMASPAKPSEQRGNACSAPDSRTTTTTASAAANASRASQRWAKVAWAAAPGAAPASPAGPPPCAAPPSTCAPCMSSSGLTPATSPRKPTSHRESSRSPAGAVHPGRVRCRCRSNAVAGCSPAACNGPSPARPRPGCTSWPSRRVVMRDCRAAGRFRWPPGPAPSGRREPTGRRFRHGMP